jgi:hypothetical protein
MSRTTIDRLIINSPYEEPARQGCEAPWTVFGGAMKVSSTETI